MFRRIIAAAAVVTLALAGPAALAAGPSKSGGGYLYRYVNDKGVQVIDSSIPPEYARKGYQVITRTGQVIEEVAPASATALEDPAAEKARREREAGMARRDGELRKLYSSPQDAERHRDRQLDALKLKADFARGQISQLASKRTTELEAAARMERRGTAVPAEQRETIERYNRQIADLEAQVAAVEKEQQELRDEFAPIIERLGVIYPDKARPATPATPATPAVPAAPVAPAATP
jgi:hypothetical protein